MRVALTLKFDVKWGASKFKTPDLEHPDRRKKKLIFALSLARALHYGLQRENHSFIRLIIVSISLLKLLDEKA